MAVRQRGRATTTDSTLFVFIRPVILRDDKFEDLKYLSGRSARSGRACRRFSDERADCRCGRRCPGILPPRTGTELLNGRWRVDRGTIARTRSGIHGRNRRAGAGTEPEVMAGCIRRVMDESPGERPRLRARRGVDAIARADTAIVGRRRRSDFRRRRADRLCPAGTRCSGLRLAGRRRIGRRI